MEFVEQSKGESSRTVLKTSNYWVHTDIGNFIDIMCGNSAYVWGYSDPQLTKAVVDQLHGVQFLRGRNNETNDLVASVNQDLLAMSGMSGIIWAVSGSDGVEAGLVVCE
jgi:acetylornithine/succinyldiaminopimelate/putrescine aminotransferase